MGISTFIIVLVLVLGQNIFFIHSEHAKEDEAEMLSKEMLRKLNQTGISAEMMSINGMGIPENKSDISYSNGGQYIEDFTNFVTNLNGWIILGQWARYHLTFFTGDMPIPKLPSSADQTVLICTVTKFPSSLTKEFVGLSNSVLTLVHYVSFENDISIEGIISSNNKTEVFFALNQDDLHERNNNWIVNNFPIPAHLRNMTIILQPRSSGDAKWAIGSIKVNGTLSSEEIGSIPLEPLSSNNKTSPNTTTTPAPMTKAPNITSLQNVTTIEPMSNSSAVPLLNITTSEDEVLISEDPLEDIQEVANAIWDAFYVFLALFCACMIALAVLVMRQR